MALAIDITVNHQTLFSYAMAGTCAENQDWLRRKRNVVELLSTSSYAAGLMLQQRETSLDARYGVSLRDYAALGGAFRCKLNRQVLSAALMFPVHRTWMTTIYCYRYWPTLSACPLAALNF